MSQRRKGGSSGARSAFGSAHETGRGLAGAAPEGAGLSRRQFLKLSLAATALAALPLAPLPASAPVYAAENVDELGPIGKKWLKLGGEAVVGAPTSGIVATPDGAAQYQTFGNGVIVYSIDWGAQFVSTGIFQQWLALNGRNEPGGANLLSYVGFPKRDYRRDAGVERAEFERGTLSIEQGTGAVGLVTGPINAHYLDLGGALGLPVGEEQITAGGGRAQAFQGGEIHWHPDTGARSVVGLIRQRWLALGGAGGVLGRPTSDEQPVLREGVEIGRVSRFRNGVIYFSPASGAWELLGTLRDEYERKYDGPAGWLGFPVGPQNSTPTSGGTYSNFQNGLLVHHAAGPFSGTEAFRDLELYLQRLEGDHDDLIGGIGGSADLYVNINISTNTGVNYSERRPRSGEYDGGKDLEEHFLLATVARGDLVVNVVMEGWDEDDWPNGDDHLGTIRATYTIDNLWGARENPRREANGDGKLIATYSLLTHLPYNRDRFRQEMFWSFENPTTAELSYNQFAATFRDVDPDESVWLHPFNRLYYELVYKGIAANGNCFGMSLESIFAQVGRSLFAEPISRYGLQTHPGLINELNIKQGYQVGSSSIWHIAELAVKGDIRNPRQTFEDSRAAHERGDYPVLCLSDGLLSSSGHAVRPYKWEKVATDRWIIFIADPNVPAAQAGDDNERCRIEVNPDANTFRYLFDIDKDGNRIVWSGSDDSGGRFFAVPFHVLSGTPRTPFWEVLALLRLGTLIIFGSAGAASQVSDDAGRTLFKPGLGRLPATWDDLQTGGAAVPNLTPALLNDGSGPAPELYVALGSGATHRYEVAARPGVPAGQPIEWVAQSATLSARLLLPATPGAADIVTTAGLHTAQKRVSVELPASGVAKAIALTVAGPEQQRWAELSQLALVPGQRITARLENGGFATSFENEGPPTSGLLRVKYGPGAPIVEVGTIQLGTGLNPPFAFDVPLSSVTLSGARPGNAGWWRSPVTVTLAARDFTGKGIARIEYRLGSPDWTSYTVPFGHAEEGLSSLFYRSRDNDGNQEGAREEVIKIDTQPPLLALEPSPTTVGLRARGEDGPRGSGIAAIECSSDGGLSWAPCPEPLEVVPDLQIRVTDVAGNSTRQRLQLREPDKHQWQFRYNPPPWVEIETIDRPVSADFGVASQAGPTQVQGGQSYNLDAVVAACTAGVTPIVRLVWYDARFEVLEPQEWTEVAGFTGTISRRITAPNAARHAQVELRGSGAGDLWYASAALALDGGANLIANGDFARGNLEGWDEQTVTGKRNLGLTEVRARVAGGVPELHIAMLQTVTSVVPLVIASPSQRVRFEMLLREASAFAVTAGDAIELRVLLRGVRLSGIALARLRFYDADGDELDVVSSDRLTGSFDWREIVVPATVPAGATTARAALRLEGAGSLWVNTVRLTEAPETD